jgi:hypothetical protein
MQIPGTEGKKIKAIEDAAEELRDVRGRRMKLTEEEAKLADKLKKLLEKHGIRTYVYESDEMDEKDQPIKFDVLIEDPEEAKVKVRKHKEKKTADPEPADD